MAKAKTAANVKLTCNLAPEHCQALNLVLQSCSDLRCFLTQLQGIGLDVQLLISENDSNETVAAQIKSAFFPDMP